MFFGGTSVVNGTGSPRAARRLMRVKAHGVDEGQARRGNAAGVKTRWTSRTGKGLPRPSRQPVDLLRCPSVRDIWRVPVATLGYDAFAPGNAGKAATPGRPAQPVRHFGEGAGSVFRLVGRKPRSPLLARRETGTQNLLSGGGEPHEPWRGSSAEVQQLQRPRPTAPAVPAASAGRRWSCRGCA